VTLLCSGAPGVLVPGQLPLPGMPAPESALLPGADGIAHDFAGEADVELAAVACALHAADPDGVSMAAAIRRALDLLLDGQHTGRYRWDQLHKTEQKHAGPLVEISIQRALGLADGSALDYTIAGCDVDGTFAHRMGGWLIQPEAIGKLLLVLQASDDEGTWSAGLVRATPDVLRAAGQKRTLNDQGRSGVRWLHPCAPLPENALVRLSERAVDAVMSQRSGQQRVNELFRRALGIRVSRTVVATVARQDDYMKRVRDGGGARGQLRAEGIVIFGDYAADQGLAVALGLPRPGPGEFVSARLTRGARVSRAIRLDGSDWTLATSADPVEPAPSLPR
jgi:hypothetical protein